MIGVGILAGVFGETVKNCFGMAVDKPQIRVVVSMPESKSADVFNGGRSGSGGEVKIFPVAVSDYGDDRRLFQPGDLAIRFTHFTIIIPTHSMGVGQIVSVVEKALSGWADRRFFPRCRRRSEVYPGNLSPYPNNLEINILNSVLQEF